MRFDLTDLKLFLHVAASGSLTAGAARSHMALASASQRVRGMEDALGVPLLLRRARGVEPTEAGRTLAHHARRVLQQMDHLHGDLAAYGQGLRGQVRLLCNTSAMAEHLPVPLAQFLAEHPGLSVELEERPSDETAEALRRGDADIGIVSDAVDVAGLQAVHFRPDPLVLVVPRAHPLAAARRVGMADAAALEFVGLSGGNPLQEHIARQARRLGQRLRYRIRVGSLEAVCRMVEQGIGAGIVPRAAALRYGRPAQLARVTLDEAWARRALLLCTRPGETLAPPAAALVRSLLAADAP